MTTAVIVPYFQRVPGLLAAAVRSALAQLGAGPFTVVVCDDGSPSPAEADLAMLAEEERAQVRLVIQSNAGAGAARNAALDAVPAGTEWIAFLDSDDRWHPDHLARSIAALQAGHDLCFGDTKREHESQTHFAAARFDPAGHLALDGLAGLYRFSGDFLTLNVVMSPVSISTVVMRASMLGDLRFQPFVFEDLLFWFDAARRQPRVAFDATMQVSYGRGNITITDSWKSPAALRRALLYQCVFMRVLRDVPLSSEQRGLLSRRMASNRRTFAMVALAQLRGGTVPAWPTMRDFAALDPHLLGAVLSAAGAELARRLPFGRPPAGA